MLEDTFVITIQTMANSRTRHRYISFAIADNMLHLPCFGTQNDGEIITFATADEAKEWFYDNRERLQIAMSTNWLVLYDISTIQIQRVKFENYGNLNIEDD